MITKIVILAIAFGVANAGAPITYTGSIAAAPAVAYAAPQRLAYAAPAIRPVAAPVAYAHHAAPVAYAHHAAPVAYGHHHHAAPVATYAHAAPVATYAHAAPVATYAHHHAAPVATYAHHHAAPVATYAQHAVPIAAAPARIAVAQPAPVYAAPVAKVAVPEHYDPHPRYSYSYGVQDTLTGDFKSAQESRDGDVVTGSYSVADPDGTIRTVTYSADSVNGFNAVIDRQGHAHVAKVAAPIAAAPLAHHHAAPLARYSYAH